jgi:hypothetical protein
VFRLKVLSLHEKKAYGKMEVYFESFFSLTVDRSEWSLPRQGSFTLGKTAPILFESETDAVQSRSGQFGIEKHLVPLTGTDSLILGHPALTLFLLPITLFRLPIFFCFGSRKQHKTVCYTPHVFLHIHPFNGM